MGLHILMSKDQNVKASLTEMHKTFKNTKRIINQLETKDVWQIKQRKTT